METYCVLGPSWKPVLGRYYFKYWHKVSGRNGGSCFLFPDDDSHIFFFCSAITIRPRKDQSWWAAAEDACYGRPGQCIVSTFADGRYPTHQHCAKPWRPAGLLHTLGSVVSVSKCLGLTLFSWFLWFFPLPFRWGLCISISTMVCCDPPHLRLNMRRIQS